MKLETKKLLYDIVEAAQAIEGYISGLDFPAFRDADMTRAAVERKFEIIGEALNRMGRSDPDVLQQISEYERIIGFRNIIVHGYDVVDVEIVWEVVSDYLPTLLREASELLET
ncbi:MAG TPA: DUF86 domain-containing protein [Candidatus Hydrogenedentes bacterium]|nr:DUF86 domain-containing protein [Candidatus Hydrogenedentota bacterium]